MSLEDLQVLNFEEFAIKCEKRIKKINDLRERVDFCLEVAAHYKHLSQIDGIGEEAKKWEDYFLKSAVGYRMQANAEDR